MATRLEIYACGVRVTELFVEVWSYWSVTRHHVLLQQLDSYSPCGSSHSRPVATVTLLKWFMNHDNVERVFHPTDTSSASEDEGSLRRQGRISSSSPYQSHPRVEHWFNKVIQGSSTSSSASSTSSHPGGRSHHTTSSSAATVLADLMSHTQIGQYPNILTRQRVPLTPRPHATRAHR